MWMQVIVCGAELFTSNAAMLPVAVYEGRAQLAQLLRNWSISYSGTDASIRCICSCEQFLDELRRSWWLIA